MNQARILASLRREVRERARECCEYCLLAESQAFFLTNLITLSRGNTVAGLHPRTSHWRALIAIGSKDPISPLLTQSAANWWLYSIRVRKGGLITST